MAKDEKQCFIIMPITTPEALLKDYRDGAEHFHHVLNCLLIPSVEKAGFEARPPTARGGRTDSGQYHQESGNRRHGAVRHVRAQPQRVF